MGLAGLLVLVGLALPLSAHAEPDNRPGDRFCFGLGVGAARGPSARFDMPELSGGLAAVYETSYWPNDYVGFGLALHLSRMSAAETTITNVDVGVPIMLGVPLRWAQPYGGVWLGFDRTYVDEYGTGNTTSGFRMAMHPIAGVNGYISRNLRVFVQWESVTLRDPACPEGMPAGSDCSDNAFAQELLIGLRGSPDWFHKKRGRAKFQTIYWSVLGTALLWGLVMWEE